MPAQRFVATAPKSPLEGVSNDAWQRFIAALEVQASDAISESGGFGSYDIRARVLVDLKYAINPRLASSVRSKREIHVCDFVLPWSKRKFLADPFAQYTVLVKSTRANYDAIRNGSLQKPKELSMAGALAILHVGGRGALRGWPKLFEHTRAVYEAARGAF